MAEKASNIDLSPSGILKWLDLCVNFQGSIVEDSEDPSPMSLMGQPCPTWVDSNHKQLITKKIVHKKSKICGSMFVLYVISFFFFSFLNNKIPNCFIDSCI